MNNYKSMLSIILLVLIFSFTCCTLSNASYLWSVPNSESIETSTTPTNDSNQNNTVSTEESIANEKKDSNSLNLESGAAVLIEQSTGQVLYSHNMHEKLRPASVTKVMSILLIMEQIDKGALSYSDRVGCSETARSMGGSQIWLDTTETLSVDEMLKAICVVSANDCVVAMAEHIAGSEEAFVQMMNDTTFKNCHGIDEDGHVTSAYDIALMSRELLSKHSDITKYTTIWMDSLRDGKSELVNTNKLIRTYKGITGLKTGSTSLALYNLSASATRDDLSLIAVIMKAPSTKLRFAEAQKLLDYGFNKFSFKSFGKKDSVIKNISVNKGVKNNVDVILQSDAGALIEKGKENQITQSVEVNDIVEAPVKKGDVLRKGNFFL